jgi:hypothetical protein
MKARVRRVDDFIAQLPSGVSQLVPVAGLRSDRIACYVAARAWYGEMASSGRLHWVDPLAPNRPGVSLGALTEAGGAVFVTNTTGRLRAWSASGGRLLWTDRPGGPHGGGVTVAGGASWSDTATSPVRPSRPTPRVVRSPTPQGYDARYKVPKRCWPASRSRAPSAPPADALGWRRAMEACWKRHTAAEGSRWC